MTSPAAAYQAGPGGALDVGREFYRRLADTPGRELVEEFVLPIRSGRAWEVAAGQLCRIVAVEGPQVGDLNLWNRHDPRERMWAARTRQLQAAHRAQVVVIPADVVVLVPPIRVHGAWRRCP